MMWFLQKLFILFVVSQVKSQYDRYPYNQGYDQSPEDDGSNIIYFSILIVIVVILISTISIIYYIRHRNGKSTPKNFRKGNPEKINSKMTLEEQIELLPYDKSFEFPQRKLKLGGQLGKGSFGAIHYATATEIVQGEESTAVAVRLINRAHDKELFQMVSRELKIMVHLGKHLNVVNLLGAVTRRMSHSELMVIFEYCPFGNLQKFLIKHRSEFIDQIVRGEDTIDPTITTKYIMQQRNHLYSAFNSPEENRALGMNNNFEEGMRTSNSRTKLYQERSDSNGYLSMEQLAFRTFTTTDLLCWSFQVARGMQYLSSQKVFHGHLAAKNILFCENNVVKICNFSSIRASYEIDNYLENPEGPMPFKWLSPETIDKKIFSTPSDVWSFGIVLWELFSLGTLPFMGIDDRHDLQRRLVNGFRLEKPHYSTTTIYNIMTSCWRMNSEIRPNFNDLEDRIYRLLERNVANFYIDMNEANMKSNVNRFNDGQKDYLKLLSVKVSSSGYVEMKSNSNTNINSQVSIV